MFEIKKQDADKQFIFGWANVAINKSGEQLVDHQGDMIDPEDLEAAAYDHVLEFRETGERHDPSLRSKGRLIESVVFTKEKMDAMGIPEGTVPQGWWVGYKVEDPDAWAKVKSGEYRMFSIDGTGKREAFEKSAEDPDFDFSDDDGEEEPKVQKAQFFKDLIAKFNPYHDKAGRFTWAGSGGVAHMTIQTKDKTKQHWADKAQAKAKFNHENNVPVRTIHMENKATGKTAEYRIMQDGRVMSVVDGKAYEMKNYTAEKIIDAGKKYGWEVNVTKPGAKPKKIDDPDGKKKEPQKKPEPKKPEVDVKPKEKPDDFNNPKKLNGSQEGKDYEFKDAERYENVWTGAEKKAIGVYTGSAYSSINTNLRNGGDGGSYAKTVKDLDSAISKTSLKESIQTYRGIGNGALESYLKSAGVTDPNQLVGAVISDKGSFVSVSMNKNTAKSPMFSSSGYVIRCVMPKGAKGLPPGKHGSIQAESEIILARTSKFKITGISKSTNGKHTYIDAEYIGE